MRLELTTPTNPKLESPNLHTVVCARDCERRTKKSIEKDVDYLAGTCKVEVDKGSIEKEEEMRRKRRRQKTRRREEGAGIG